MELALREAKARLSELIAAAQNGERVIITKYGEPAVELVRFRRRGGIDFDKLNAARLRFGLEEDGEVWTADLDDPVFSHSQRPVRRTPAGSGPGGGPQTPHR